MAICLLNQYAFIIAEEDLNGCLTKGSLDDDNAPRRSSDRIGQVSHFPRKHPTHPSIGRGRDGAGDRGRGRDRLWREQVHQGPGPQEIVQRGVQRPGPGPTARSQQVTQGVGRASNALQEVE